MRSVRAASRPAAPRQAFQEIHFANLYCVDGLLEAASRSQAQVCLEVISAGSLIDYEAICFGWNLKMARCVDDLREPVQRGQTPHESFRCLFESAKSVC